MFYTLKNLNSYIIFITEIVFEHLLNGLCLINYIVIYYNMIKKKTKKLKNYNKNIKKNKIRARNIKSRELASVEESNASSRLSQRWRLFIAMIFGRCPVFSFPSPWDFCGTTMGANVRMEVLWKSIRRLSGFGDSPITSSGLLFFLRN